MISGYDCGGETYGLSDTQSDTYTLLSCLGSNSNFQFASTSVYSTIIPSSASTTLTITCTVGGNGCAADVLLVDIEAWNGVTGLDGIHTQKTVNTASSSGTSATTGFNVANYVFDIGLLISGNGGAGVACGSWTLDSHLTTIAGGCNIKSGGNNYVTWATSYGTGTGTYTNSWSIGTTTGNGIAHLSFVLTLASSTGTAVTVTQCYGNCGNPAITLVNTNSTHTVNFNQSITLLYQFQSNLNGFVNNVTVNLGKTYPDGLRSPFLALYIQDCPAGATPMTGACPATQKLGSNTGATNKGRATITAGQVYPVTAGQWIVIGVSAQFSGLDLNDTNTGLQMYRANGMIPTTIISATVFNPSALVGMWAFITGNVVIAPPPIEAVGACSNNFANLDCLLPALVNTFCNQLTSACQTQSALLWVVILTMIFLAIFLGVIHNVFPSMSFNFSALGNMFMLLMLITMFIFWSAGLLPPYLPIFFFFVVSLVIGKKEGLF